MKKKITFLLAALLLLTGCSRFEAAPELLEPVDVQVQTTAVTRGNIEDITVYEAFTKPEVLPCSFLAAGQVQEVLVSRGDRVAAGDVLARLNTDLLAAQAAALQAQLDDLTAQTDFAQRRFEWNAQLLALENSADAQARLALLESQQEQASGERALQRADLEAQLEQTNRSIASGTLTASCDGTVLYVGVYRGSMVGPGMTAALLADDTQAQVVTEYIEDRVLLSAVETYATIGGVKYALESQPYDRAEYLSRKAAGETLQSAFRVEDPEGTVKAGMYTLLYLVSARSEDTLLLPATAVFHDAAGYYVYQFSDAGQVRVDVEAGVMTGAQVEILAGLEEGDAVYVGS